jgi:hypothetical protein
MLLAERKHTKAENERRAVGRWLAGTGISDENCEALSEVFGYEPDYFKTPDAARITPWRAEAEALRQDVRELSDRIRALEEPRRSRRRADGAPGAT